MHERAGDESRHESFVHHPIHATVHEAAHVREIAVAILIALDFEVPHV